MLRQLFIFRGLSFWKKKAKLLLQSTNWWYVLIIFIPPLSIFGSTGFAEVTPVADRTTAVRDTIVAAVPNVDAAADISESQLATITSLDLRSKGITELKTGDFSGLTGLISLNLFRNSLSRLPDDIFEGLTSLTTLRLGRNAVDPLPIALTLVKVGENQVKVVVPACSPSDITISITVNNGIISDNVTTLTVNRANRESNAVTVTRSEGTTDAVTVNIGDTLPTLPQGHYGYTFVKDSALPIEIISEISTPDVTPEPESPSTPVDPDPEPIEPENAPPTFTEGAITVRKIVENTEKDTNIGEVVAATDTDEDDILSYYISGFDADSFAIDSTTGQLKTKAMLDYEKKHLYLIAVNVSDGTISDTISVIISVIDEVDVSIVSVMPPVNDRTFAVKEAIVEAVSDVDNADDITADHLATITALNLRSKNISELKSGDFYGLTALTNLNLYGNNLRRLPMSMFEGLTSLSTVRLGGNIYDPLLLTVSIQQVDTNQFRLIIPTGAPFDVSLRIEGNTVEVPQGDLISETFISTGIPTIDTLPSIPVTHFGYILVKSTTCSRSLKVQEAIVSAVSDVNHCSLVSEIDLAMIRSLNLREMEIKSLRGDDFAGMLSLNDLNLSKNELETLPDGIFKGLISLEKLNLSENSVEPLAVHVYLEKDEDEQFSIVVPTGTPFEMVFPLTVINGRSTDDVTSITLKKGETESDSFTISRIPNTLGAVTLDVDIPDLPAFHSGYEITKSWEQPLEIFSRINVSPEFSEGDSTARTISEMTESGADIGSSIIATDRNEEVLTYTLGGTDAAYFDIDSSNGQLKTKSPLDYEEKSAYAVTITVSDGELTDTIAVTISILDVNEAPVFAIDNITRAIAENTAADTNIGAAITASDPDGDTLSYSLGGEDATAFAIDSTTGQLKTKVSLDYEKKKTYALTITASDDSNLTDTVSVTINIMDIDENVAPIFTEGETAALTIAENTEAGTNIGEAVSATDANGDALTYTLGGVDKASFSIDSATGQLSTKAPLDYEQKSMYSVTITVSDGKLRDTISVTINIMDIEERDPKSGSSPTVIEFNIPAVNNAPVFNEGSSTTRIVAENTISGENIGSPVAASDADKDDLTYTLSGTDASSFSIIRDTGQLQTNASLDYETKSSYSVTITVSDGNNGSDTISVTINIADVQESQPGVESPPTNIGTDIPAVNNPPVFNEGSSTTRIVAENTLSGENIGSPVAATDAENDDLTYNLGGTDANSFGINSSTGQLQTSASLDYEGKSSYSVTITVSDGNNGSDTIIVTINISDVDEAPDNIAPTFSEGDSTTRSIAENTGSGVDIGSAVTARDENEDTLTYTLSGTDATSFSVDSSSGQLRTRAPLDYETKSSYSVTLSVSDNNGGTDSISITITITDINEVPANNAPVFNDGDSTTRTVAENTAAGTDIGSEITATDADRNELTYGLTGSNASTFSIVSTSGQLKTKAALNHEATSSYSLTVTVSDGQGGGDSINVTINVTDVNEAPEFDDGTTTSRSIAENSAADTNIGAAVKATDPDDGAELTYTLGGTDAASFAIDDGTGQLKTKAPLDFEEKQTYAVTVSVTDGSLNDNISVTIDVSDLNEVRSNKPPAFDDGTSTERSVAENTEADANIGSAVSASDDDGDELTYTLGGSDASSFSIDSDDGQLKTKSALNYESKNSYSVTITVSDGSTTVNISVKINVTDVNEAPVYAGDSVIRSVAENTAAGADIGSPVTANDPEGDDLTYTLSGTDASSFSIDEDTGQLKTQASLDFEDTSSYSVTVTAEDPDNLSDSINVTINVRDVDENRAPTFPEGTSTSREIPENTGAGVDIGSPVAAEDLDNDELTYTLGGTDATSFDINSATGQLRTKSSLDFEDKSVYSVTITVSDTKATDTITVTINVKDVDENHPPEFTEGPTTSRSIPENTAANENIGSPVSADDDDTDDTLTYSLGGTDAASFDIVSTSGQLKTKAALDFEDKNAYSVTITVSDTKATDTIIVTINVSDVDENHPPEFTEGPSTSRSIAENTAANENIGSPVSADDDDTDDTLTYTLSGTNAASFDIVSTSGQLKTKAALDYEEKRSYTVTITVSDTKATDTITVTINVSDVDENHPPEFTEGPSTTRSIPENTTANENIGSPVSAEDDDNDTLTYTLSGTDAASFDIVSTSGQLKTKAALDFEDKNAYSVTITVSDTKATDTITVTINVSDVDENHPPEFTEGPTTTRSIPENTAANQNIGTPVSADDDDTDDTLTYTLGGTDAASFDIVSTSGQLKTKAALDYEQKRSYTVTITVSDTKATDTITVTINVSDVDENSAPSFTEGETATRSIPENTAANQNIGTPVSADDDDTDDTLTYTLGGTDAESFAIVRRSGQLKTKAALDYEEKREYTVTITVSDTKATDTITVTITVTDISDSHPLYGRTQKVQNAIVAKVSGIDSAEDVTDTHLAAITSLNFNRKSISSLNGNDFDGLSGLTELSLIFDSISSLPDGIFNDLSSLEKLNLSTNEIGSLDDDVFDALTSLKELDLSNNQLSSLPDGVLDQLTSLEIFRISNNSIGSLASDIFSNNTSLEELNLAHNTLSSLPDNLLKGLTALNKLTTSFNTGWNHDDYIDISVTLRKTADGEFKAAILTGAPFDMSVQLRATNGSITGGNSVTISTGSVESSAVTVTRTEGTTAAVTVDIRRLPTLPSGHSGYQFVKVSADLPLTVIDATNGAPATPMPDATILLPNYPNPFNPETWIPYQLSKPGDVSITIYDVRGVAVRRLEIGNRSAGYYLRRSRAAHWDGRNVFGEKVAGGVYFYVFTAGDYSATRKMLILK